MGKYSGMVFQLVKPEPIVSGDIGVNAGPERPDRKPDTFDVKGLFSKQLHSQIGFCRIGERLIQTGSKFKSAISNFFLLQPNHCGNSQILSPGISGLKPLCEGNTGDCQIFVQPEILKIRMLAKPKTL